MLPEKKRKQIIDLMNREVVPAMGCTEPIAVALCAAKCAEVLGKTPDKIILHLSANILKNAMGVGIPGTGMIGLPIAIALGVTIGKSEYNLEVIRDVNPEAVKAGQRYIDEKRISINLKTGITEKLYIEAESFDTEGNSAVAVISGGHTNFIKIARNGETILDNTTSSATSHTCDDEELDLHTVYEFATTTPIDELKFILEAKKLNKSIAEHSFGQKYGHAVGRTLNCERQRKIMGDSAFARILSYTTAACDARMAGAPIPVMSNSGSGNQGIAATMPVVVYAEENNAYAI